MRLPSRRSILLVGAAACADVHADDAHDAIFVVTSPTAQFYRQAMPPVDSEGDAGPKVLSASTGQLARAGSVDQLVSGVLEQNANAVAVGFVSDVGYWILPAAPPQISAPKSPTFDSSFSISRSAPVGSGQIVFRAVDGEGHFGPPELRALAVEAATTPTGRFVIALTWQNTADLDLHVVLPSGLELFKRNRTEYQHPSASAGPTPPGTPLDGGVLDRDANANCVFGGVQAEDAVWTEPPPSGHYIIRVDTSSLCGEASSPWRLEAIHDGVLVAAAQGEATTADLRFPHDRGGGVLALELDLP